MDADALSLLGHLQKGGLQLGQQEILEYATVVLQPIEAAGNFHKVTGQVPAGDHIAVTPAEDLPVYLTDQKRHLHDAPKVQPSLSHAWGRAMQAECYGMVDPGPAIRLQLPGFREPANKHAKARVQITVTAVDDVLCISGTEPSLLSMR